MVAAAAAAAAASAASGKPVNAPDLPSFNKWLSISTSIIDALLSGRNVLSGQSESKIHTSHSEKKDQLPAARSSAIETALSCLASNSGLNMKFSSSWCQRVLPAAKEMYLKGLPAFYPTSMHELQLQKALRSFHSMVKGPAVQVFSKELEDECQTIWESGRQQCDAVSLTGRPCKHRRHGDLSSSDAVEPHSSGYVFLHACACGRSRRLRDNPFDFQSANISFNYFSNCEDLLPTLVLPRGSDAGSFSVSSWRLVRLGGARYYKPTKGLLQSGFSSKEKYLLRWMISVGKRQVRNSNHSNTIITSSTRSNMDPQTPPVVTSEVKPATTKVTPQIKSAKLQNSGKQPEMESMNNSGINFGKGLPNFTMKKPFAEVVAGTTAKDEFPALQHTRPPKPGARKDERQMSSISDQTNGRGNAALSQGPIAESESEKMGRNKSSENADGKPFFTDREQYSTSDCWKRD
uniref:Nonsense-mediated mRNA decay factor SMG8 n=1 Tax=Arundo donax TaxID=35708 RepID=A0A0A9CLS7_ARUDO